MKVLLLNQVFYPDGSATSQHNTDLALFLKEQGCEVTVLAARQDYNRPEIKYAAQENYKGIQIYRVPTLGLGKHQFWRRVVDSIAFEAFLFFKLLSLPRQDFVIAFTSPPLIGLFGSIFCGLKGGKLVQWLMDINPDAAIAVGYIAEGSLTARVLRAIFKFTLRRSDSIVVLDRWMQKHIQTYGVPAEKITVVPPAPVPEMLATPPSESPSALEFKRRHQLENKFVVLYSGNHSVVHPLDTLLEAARLLKHDSEIRFVFTGSGLRVPEVRAFAEKYGLSNIVQLPHQPREFLKDSLSMGDLHVVVLGEAVSGLVHPSKVYGILATGKPYLAIAPRASTLGDLLEKGPHGYLANHRDPNRIVDIVRAVQKLTAEEKRAIRTQNFNYLVDNFDPHALLSIFARSVLKLEAQPALTPRTSRVLG